MAKDTYTVDELTALIDEYRRGLMTNENLDHRDKYVVGVTLDRLTDYLRNNGG
jgi:hypothetical protein